MNYNICLCFVQHKIVIFCDFMFVLLVIILKNQLLCVILFVSSFYIKKQSVCICTPTVFDHLFTFHLSAFQDTTQDKHIPH